MTTLSDNFNRSDNTNISTGAPFSWTEGSGDWSISSNRLRRGTGTGGQDWARADSDLASDDNYCESELYWSDDNDSMGVVCRMSASAFTGYVFFWRPSTTSWYLFKVEAGTFTALADSGVSTHTSGDVIKVEANGSTIKGYRNSSEIASVSNSDITTGKRCGLQAGTSPSREYDNFAAADLGVATAKPKTLMMLGVG